MVSFNLLGYKDQSYQIAFLFIVVADGIKDQTGTKRVLKTTVAIFLSSATVAIFLSSDGCNRMEATGDRSNIGDLCSISKFMNRVGTQVTKNKFKPVRGCVHRYVQSNPK